MITGVRETSCHKCVHLDVCINRNNYLKMVDQLEKLYYSIPEEDRSAMFFKDPGCKFYQSISIPKPKYPVWRGEIQQKIIDSEETEEMVKTMRKYDGGTRIKE